MTDFKDQLNLIGYGLLAVSIIVSLLAIVLSKKGRRTSFWSSISYICLLGFLILGYYRLENLASANNLTTLIQDVTIRSKASVPIAAAVVVLNCIPFFTYRTPEDAKLKEEQKKARKRVEEEQQRQI